MFTPCSIRRAAEIERRQRRYLGTALAVITGIGIVVTAVAIGLLDAPGALVLLPV